MTLALTGVALVLSILPAPGGPQLGYDRAAVAEGQFWRPFTGQLVHWTPRMALVDLSVVLAFGCWLERRSRGVAAGAILLALFSIGAGIHFWLTKLDTYRGSSGLATACFAATAAFLVCDSTLERQWRWSGLAALTLLAAKIAWEIGSGAALAAGALPPGIQVVPQVHLIGALAGLASAGAGAWLRTRAAEPA